MRRATWHPEAVAAPLRRAAAGASAVCTAVLLLLFMPPGPTHRQAALAAESKPVGGVALSSPSASIAASPHAQPTGAARPHKHHRRKRHKLPKIPPVPPPSLP